MSKRQTGFADDRGASFRTPPLPNSTLSALREVPLGKGAFLNKALALMNDAIGPEVGHEGASLGAAADTEHDPFVAIQLSARLLMKKARLHVVAVLNANRTSNLHSMAVQMRPALECAGQVVLVFHNIFTAVRPAPEAIAQYLNSDYYQPCSVSPEDGWATTTF